MKPSATDRWFWAALIAILAIAALLQFWTLDAKSLWEDELGTIRIAVQPDFSSLVAAFQASERQPPLHYLVMQQWVRAFGSGDVAVRVPSAIFAVGSVAVTAWLGWRIAGRNVALISAYLLALSPFVVLYGRMARYYSLALLTAIVSTALLVEVLRWIECGRNDRRLWIAYAVATVAMLLTSYPSVAVFGAQGLFVLLFIWRQVSVRPGLPSDGNLSPAAASVPAGRSSRLRPFFPWLIAQIAIVAAFGAWLLFEWTRITGFGVAPSPFAAQGLTAVLLKVFYPIYAFTLGETIFPWQPGALIGGVVLAVAGALGLWACRRLGVWGLLPALGFALPLLVTVFAFQVFVRDLPFITLATRTVGALPFLLMLFAIGIAAAKQPIRIALLAGVTIAYGIGDANYFTNRHFNNPIYAVPTRELAAEFARSTSPRDLIVADWDINLNYYYRPGPERAPYLETRNPTAVQADVESGRYDRVILVTFGRDRTRTDAPDALRAWLESHLQLASTAGYVPQDPVYSRIKQQIQGFQDYQYKLLVEEFRPRAG